MKHNSKLVNSDNAEHAESLAQQTSEYVIQPVFSVLSFRASDNLFSVLSFLCLLLLIQQVNGSSEPSIFCSAIQRFDMFKCTLFFVIYPSQVCLADCPTTYRTFTQVFMSNFVNGVTFGLADRCGQKVRKFKVLMREYNTNVVMFATGEEC